MQTRATQLTVEFVREGYVESEHPVSAVLVDDQGRVLERIGQECVTTWRSGAKPFQLVESLAHLPAEWTQKLTDEQLAIGAASHSAEPFHTATVSDLLAQFGLGPEALFCGVHPPMHKPSELALAREGLSPTVLDSNCSGKHTFMAAAVKQRGWPADYRSPAHPLQVAIRQSVNEFAANRVVDTVTDGCGIPCLVLELAGMARAYAVLGVAGVSLDDALPSDALKRLGRVARAMMAAPQYVSGTDRSDLALVSAAREPVISKVGAEGLLCLALPQRGQAIALKIRSGHEDARMAATRALLRRWCPELIADSESLWATFCTIRSVALKDVGVRIGRFH
jgi:L-asparaginase II